MIVNTTVPIHHPDGERPQSGELRLFLIWMVIGGLISVAVAAGQGLI